jgi:hypothetical protein
VTTEPEFAANAIADWCHCNGSATVFIDPGLPWQNAWVESFNSRLRDEFLNGQLFDSLVEAHVLLEDWRDEDSHDRLHNSLGYLTPVEFNEASSERSHHGLSLAVAHLVGSPQLRSWHAHFHRRSPHWFILWSTSRTGDSRHRCKLRREAVLQE